MPEVACDPGALLDMAYRAVPQPDDHVVIGLLFRRELRRIELNRPAFTLRPAGRGGAGIKQYSGHQQTALHIKQGKGIDAIGCLCHLGQRIAGPLGLPKIRELGRETCRKEWGNTWRTRWPPDPSKKK